MDVEKLRLELLANLESSSEESDTEEIDDGTGKIRMTLEKIRGLRAGTFVYWSKETKCLYYKNTQIPNSTYYAYTCYDKKCTDRCFMDEATGDAYSLKRKHNIAHGSMYHIYNQMIYANKMKDRCLNAPASMTLRDVYNEIVLEYVLFIFDRMFVFLFLNFDRLCLDGTKIHLVTDHIHRALKMWKKL